MGAYDHTLNLPRTDFPMRANLPQREPEIQESWESTDLYGRLRKERLGKPKFILHDGPPYANGHIHIGTAMNKILKDFVVRFATMRGYDAPYVPGWDTHGLPIEHRALTELKIDRRKISPADLRDHCADFARKYIKVMTGQFKRLGVLGDWENPYITLDPRYEARQIEVFGEMVRNGHIYKGLKPVYWCASCETALAEAEIEYREKTSPSIYVTFPVVEGKGVLREDALVVIWTTTPWTLPGNTAVALHPEGDYILVETSAGKLLLAEPLAERLLSAVGLEKGPVLGKWKGRYLEGVNCGHPFLDRKSPLVLADYVSMEEGTGCVHNAPGHGPDDFDTGRRYNLPVVVPVDGRGKLTEEAGPFVGLGIEEANKAIPKRLKEWGRLLHLGTVQHQYAHCWRCKGPVIWRATEQWFASVDGFRDRALEAIKSVKWVPAWGETRITNMVASRADWCISRQRAWGVPIPAFYCNACGEHLITEDTIRAVVALFEREGSNAWFRREAAEILPEGAVCPSCSGTDFRKETDTMDVWFDSGSSHAAVLAQRPELSWPADLYLEGSDQHRGWFQSSLLTSVATRGQAPYRSVLTHGFVVDGEGRKMSKSLGNVVEPEEVIKQFGADILRLWVASSDYTNDVRVSGDILKQMAEVYRKIRNTIRFILGNLNDFDPAKDSLFWDSNRAIGQSLPEVDRWALHRLQEVVERVTAAYAGYEFHMAYRHVHEFCVSDLSTFYLDILKDRLYTAAPSSPERKAGQSVLYEVVRALILLISPILAHTSEEAWGYLTKRPGDPDSVHLASWPEPQRDLMDEELVSRWRAVRQLREIVSRELEEVRKSGLIGSSLEANVELGVGPGLLAVLEPLTETLADIFIVSSVKVLNINSDPYGPDPLPVVKVSPAQGEKCQRCWHYSETVGRFHHEDLCERCASIVGEHYSGKI